MNGTASVFCVDSISSISEYQVILLQQNGRNNLTVLTLRSGRQLTLPIPSGRYCILELPMEDNELMYSEVRYSREFIAEDLSVTDGTTTITTDACGGIDMNVIISKTFFFRSTIAKVLIFVLI